MTCRRKSRETLSVVVACDFRQELPTDLLYSSWPVWLPWVIINHQHRKSKTSEKKAVVNLQKVTGKPREDKHLLVKSSRVFLVVPGGRERARTML
eukprot:scaffold2259_cov180-Amphora_coffeaeformis.AAC.7